MFKKLLGWVLVVVGFIGLTMSFALPGNPLNGTFFDSIWFTLISGAVLFGGWQLRSDK